MEQFVIHKSLTKDPMQYPDAKSQPHVQVIVGCIPQQTDNNLSTNLLLLIKLYNHTSNLSGHTLILVGGASHESFG